MWKHIFLAPAKLYKNPPYLHPAIEQGCDCFECLIRIYLHSNWNSVVCFMGEELKLLAIICILGPMWYAILGFVSFVIFVAIYNLLAKKLGGFEFEVTDVKSAV